MPYCICRCLRLWFILVPLLFAALVVGEWLHHHTLLSLNKTISYLFSAYIYIDNPRPWMLIILLAGLATMCFSLTCVRKEGGGGRNKEPTRHISAAHYVLPSSTPAANSIPSTAAVAPSNSAGDAPPPYSPYYSPAGEVYPVPARMMVVCNKSTVQASAPPEEV